jgi:protein TonB
MVAYLAIPAPVAQRILDQQAGPERKSIKTTAQPKPAPQAPKKDREATPEPSAAETIQEQRSLVEPAPLKDVSIPEQVEPVPEVSETVFNDEILKTLRVNQQEDESGDNVSLAQNTKPRTQNSAKAMLAFADDPAALGRILPLSAGAGFVEARILALPEPAYPVLSRKRGEEGRVMLEVTISAEGGVRGARVQTSSNYSRLDRAALTAVRKATFVPAIRYGTPVESVTKVAYRFELEN